jgi:hypothetical protein
MQISRKLIVEQPNYDLVFEHVQENRDSAKRYYVSGQYVMMNKGNKNRRIYEESEMVPAVETYIKDYVLENRGGGELNHCVPDTYSILTYDGWKQLKNISHDETVATLNTASGHIEYKQITEKINEEYSGKMIRIRGRNINLLMTPEHRVLIKNRKNEYEYLTAQQIFDTQGSSTLNHSFIPKTGEWDKQSPAVFTLPGIKNTKKLGNYKNDISQDIDIDYNTFICFLGLYLAEGHCDMKNYGVYITQIKDKFKSEIWEMLCRFPEELKWVKTKRGFACQDKRLNSYVRTLGKVNNKHIPLDIKHNSSAEDLEDLFYWFNIGDGRFNLIADKYSVRNVFTISSSLIQDLNECLLKAGYSGNLSILEQKDSVIQGRDVLAENTKPLFLLNFSKTSGIYLDNRFLTITEEHFQGSIGCVTNANSNWYCMDDAGKTYWTGNSDKPDVDLTKLADKIVHLERDRHDPDYYIGRSLVLSTPSGKILESLIQDGVKFGKSTKCLGQINESSDGYNRVKMPILVLVDNVFDPSVSTAFVNGICENRDYIIGDDGKIAQAYEALDKSLSKYPSRHSDEIRSYVFETLQKFLATI